ncbi:hypothetical protein ACJMK2_038017 [Sinanodonta woodiana]|uniref:Uncharacterized protein n=1 Tax=Sinanodonta woodiana TaxID=1069815 RepID=A0ABD3WRE7_SINWO
MISDDTSVIAIGDDSLLSGLSGLDPDVSISGLDPDVSISGLDPDASISGISGLDPDVSISGLDPDASNSETGSRKDTQVKNVASSLLFSALFSMEEDIVTDVEESVITDIKQQNNLGLMTDLLKCSPFNKQFASLGQLSHTKPKSGCYTTQTLGYRETSVKNLENKNMLHSKISNTASLQHAKLNMIPRTAPVNSVGHLTFQNISSSSAMRHGESSQISQISSELPGVVPSAFGSVTNPTSKNTKLKMPKSVIIDSWSSSLGIKESPSRSEFCSSVDNTSDKFRSNTSNAVGKLEKQRKEASQEKPYKLSAAEKSVSPGIYEQNKNFSTMSNNGHREFRNGSVHIMGILPPLENQGASWNLATDCYMAAVSNNSYAHNEQPGGGKMLRKRQHVERSSVTSQSVNIKKSKMETLKEPNFASPISISQPPDCQSSSTERKTRYDKTAAALQQSGLMDITIKTAELLRKNAALQKELQKLKQETSLFLYSVLNNPENEALRNFLKSNKAIVTMNVK